VLPVETVRRLTSHSRRDFPLPNCVERKAVEWHRRQIAFIVIAVIIIVAIIIIINFAIIIIIVSINVIVVFISVNFVVFIFVIVISPPKSPREILCLPRAILLPFGVFFG